METDSIASIASRGARRPGDARRSTTSGLSPRTSWRLRLLVAGVATAALAPARARADDGPYVAESFGVATGRGRLAGVLGSPLHLRIALGMRIGDLAIEPWILSDLQTDRVGAFKGLVGGEPAEGTADLEVMGLDAKYIVALDDRIEVFVRGGPLAADGTGALADFHGRGLGIAAGAQISGKVRALGFLWSPLFFLKRGPLVTGALFLDAGYDLYFLRQAHGSDVIDARVGHVSVGFAIGSAF